MGKTQFEKKQIEEFKEAFGLLDKNQDGRIDDKELRECFGELGRNVNAAECKDMLAEVDGPMNFNAFINLFGDKLSGTDDEQMLLEAFKLVDDTASGQIHKAVLKDLLTANGKPADRLTEAEVNFAQITNSTLRLTNLFLTRLKFNQSMEHAPVDRSGNVDYAAFVALIKNGKNDDE